MLHTGKQGFVYVLINQALPNCVKIGRTTRDSAARAAELSSATGVPTPFLVAFEAYFENCHEAETYIHTLLESEGVRLASNREFFSVSASNAINAVIQAQKRFETSPIVIPKDPLSNQGSDAIDIIWSNKNSLVQPPWAQILEEASDYLYGNDEKIEDKEKAIALFKKAAKLGSGEAYTSLGDCYQGIIGLDWVKRGADAGHSECWLMLSEIFMGGNFYFSEIPVNSDNARKSYCKFFELVDVANSDDRKLYFALERYMKIINGKPNQFDINSLQNFIPKFLDLINGLPSNEDQLAKKNQLDSLCEKYSRY
jgi:hypothetical protein